MNVLKRAALTAALVTAAVVGTQPADAVVGDCTSRFQPSNVPGYTDCVMNGLGWCIYMTDPMTDPPNNVVPQTAWFVGCAV